MLSQLAPVKAATPMAFTESITSSRIISRPLQRVLSLGETCKAVSLSVQTAVDDLGYLLEIAGIGNFVKPVTGPKPGGRQGGVIWLGK